MNRNVPVPFLGEGQRQRWPLTRLLAFDPLLSSNQIKQLGCIPCQTAQQTLVGADALATLTQHSEFAHVPVVDIVSAIASDCIFDPVGALPQLRGIV